MKNASGFTIDRRLVLVASFLFLVSMAAAWSSPWLSIWAIGPDAQGAFLALWICLVVALLAGTVAVACAGDMTGRLILAAAGAVGTVAGLVPHITWGLFTLPFLFLVLGLMSLAAGAGLGIGLLIRWLWRTGSPRAGG